MLYSFFGVCKTLIPSRKKKKNTWVEAVATNKDQRDKNCDYDIQQQQSILI